MTVAWPFGDDADRYDPLTALRIPVTGSHPRRRYIAAFDRESQARPTDAEALVLASFIEEYKAFHFNDWYKAQLLERPLDVDATTRIFHKWGEGDWSYRLATWQYGPTWSPVPPRLRDSASGALSLVEVMDRTHCFGADEPMPDWVEWKAAHPEIFGAPPAREAAHDAAPGREAS